MPARRSRGDLPRSQTWCLQDQVQTNVEKKFDAQVRRIKSRQTRKNHLWHLPTTRRRRANRRESAQEKKKMLKGNKKNTRQKSKTNNYLLRNQQFQIYLKFEKLLYFTERSAYRPQRTDSRPFKTKSHERNFSLLRGKDNNKKKREGNHPTVPADNTSFPLGRSEREKRPEKKNY